MGVDMTALVLAAGEGKRMRSRTAKVLHKVNGRAMIDHVLSALALCPIDAVLVVTGHDAESVEKHLAGRAVCVRQTEQLGTAHAVMQARELLVGKPGHVIVLCGDTPLLRASTLQDFVQRHVESGAAASVLTAEVPNPFGYGRILRNAMGQISKIVEEADADPATKAIREINAGIYCFQIPPLLSALDSITTDNEQGEYYLTDVIPIMLDSGLPVAAKKVNDAEEILGVNNRRQLAAAEQIMRQRTLDGLMDAGVTIIDPAHTYVQAGVQVGQDTVLYPGTILEGETVIGRDCQIGPGVRLIDCHVGDQCRLEQLLAIESVLGNGVTAGPFTYLRPGTRLGDEVKIGGFVEVKNSRVGEKSKIPHLSYVGDADIGAGVNIGAGVIVVNYDGKTKHRTIIEDGAFVGCNVNLVAPVTVGRGAYVAAGSTVTRDVAPGSLAIARARQETKKDWARKFRHR